MTNSIPYDYIESESNLDKLINTLKAFFSKRKEYNLNNSINLCIQIINDKSKIRRLEFELLESLRLNFSVNNKKQLSDFSEDMYRPFFLFEQIIYQIKDNSLNLENIGTKDNIIKSIDIIKSSFENNNIQTGYGLLIKKYFDLIDTKNYFNEKTEIIDELKIIQNDLNKFNINICQKLDHLKKIFSKINILDKKLDEKNKRKIFELLIAKSLSDKYSNNDHGILEDLEYFCYKIIPELISITRKLSLMIDKDISFFKKFKDDYDALRYDEILKNTIKSEKEFLFETYSHEINMLNLKYNFNKVKDFFIFNTKLISFSKIINDYEFVKSDYISSKK